MTYLRKEQTVKICGSFYIIIQTQPKYSSKKAFSGYMQSSFLNISNTKFMKYMKDNYKSSDNLPLLLFMSSRAWFCCSSSLLAIKPTSRWLYCNGGGILNWYCKQKSDKTVNYLRSLCCPLNFQLVL